MHTKLQPKNLEGEKHLEDLGTYRRTMLKQILKKHCTWVLT